MRSEELAGIGLCWKVDLMKSENRNNPESLCYTGGVKEKHIAAYY